MTADDLEGVRITIDDMRPDHCARGIRRWFDANGLDLRDFLENGIEAKALFATGDPLVIAVIEKKLNG